MQFTVESGIELEEGLALVRRQGWESSPSRFTRPREIDPAGSFTARGARGEALGIVTCVVWPGAPSLAWVGSMLVDEAARGRGVGRALLRAALAHAEARGAGVVGLDATEAGRALYGREGFVAVGTSARYERPVGAARPPPGPSGDYAVYPVSSAEVMELMEYDRPRFGASRARLLSAFMSERPHHAYVAVHRRTGKFSGLAMSLPERMGPLVAEAPEAAAWLLHACERAGTPPKAIVAEWNPDARAVFEAAGYQRQNACTRMFRGGPPPGMPERVYCPAAWALG